MPAMICESPPFDSAHIPAFTLLNPQHFNEGEHRASILGTLAALSEGLRLVL